MLQKEDVCPICQATEDDLDYCALDISDFGDTIWREMHCKKCGSHWTTEYTLQFKNHFDICDKEGNLIEPNK